MAHMKKRAWKLSSAALAGEKKSLQFGAGRWCPNPWCMVFNTKGGCICIYIYIRIYIYTYIYIYVQYIIYKYPHVYVYVFCSVYQCLYVCI